MDTNAPPNPVRTGRNARFGMILFIVYLLLYGGFIALNAFDYKRMTLPVDWAGGLNGEVVYGFGLIFGAFVLAIVYMALCRLYGDDEEVAP